MPCAFSGIGVRGVNYVRLSDLLLDTTYERSITMAMRMNIEQALDHKRILLDLIEDPDIAVCMHRMGPFEKRGELSTGLATIINKHINNMKREISEFVNKPSEEGGLGLSRDDLANCPEPNVE